MSSTEPTALTPVADGLWTASDPVRILGMRLTATMSLVRLDGGSLLAYSPVSLTDERRAAVDAIGEVAHVYSPNLFHHLSVGAWAEAWPSARVHGPPGLAKKRPDLRVDREHGEPEPAFESVVDEVTIEGFRLHESVLCYRPARALLLADLVHNVEHPAGAWTRFYTWAMGFNGRVALSRMIRWTAFSDRAAARRSIDAVLELPFDTIVVGHGSPVTDDAKGALAAAFSWLPAAKKA